MKMLKQRRRRWGAGGACAPSFANSFWTMRRLCEQSIRLRIWSYHTWLSSYGPVVNQVYFYGNVSLCIPYYVCVFYFINYSAWNQPSLSHAKREGSKDPKADDNLEHGRKIFQHDISGILGYKLCTRHINRLHNISF